MSRRRQLQPVPVPVPVPGCELPPATAAAIAAPRTSDIMSTGPRQWPLEWPRQPAEPARCACLSTALVLQLVKVCCHARDEVDAFPCSCRQKKLCSAGARGRRRRRSNRPRPIARGRPVSGAMRWSARLLQAAKCPPSWPTWSPGGRSGWLGSRGAGVDERLQLRNPWDSGTMAESRNSLSHPNSV